METNKPKLIMFYGLPASGKSTKAKELVDKGYVRTNKDSIRAEYFPDYKRKDEKKVIKERNRQIIDALQKGKNIIVDDTNLNPIHKKELSKLAREYNAEFIVDDSFLQVSLTECIARDKKRADSVGENVIRKMYHQYIAPKFDGNEYDPTLPYCVISDIDGTLAHMNGKRSPYDWHKVGLDDIDLGVAHVIDAINLIGYATVFLFSGRDEVCRPETVEWLQRHDIQYEALYMRRSNHVDEHGGNVKDTVVKKEMYEKYIKGKYNVLFVMDDRPLVCDQWRDDFKLRVMQLGDPNYHF